MINKLTDKQLNVFLSLIFLNLNVELEEIFNLDKLYTNNSCTDIIEIHMLLIKISRKINKNTLICFITQLNNN